MYRMLPVLILLLVWVYSLRTTYRRMLSIILVGVLILNTIPILNIYIPRNIESYKEGSLVAGDIISTFKRVDQDPLYKFSRHVFLVINGYSYYHTVVVVEYKGGLYVLHANPIDALKKSREGTLYFDKIETIRAFPQWDMCLEPLESFIEEERKSKSLFQISNVGQSLVYNERAVQSIPYRENFVNCCYYLGKYLEGSGFFNNDTPMPDALYYLPQLFHNNFVRKKDIQL